MKKILSILVITTLLVTMFTSLSYADNPIVQTIYTADPAPMVYNGTLYVYTGHDEDNSKYFTMNDWRCYSTTDMVNWTDHGVVMDYKTFSWAKGDAWAGQVIERDGKFYYYVPLTDKRLNKPVIGVGVSDSPTGPFKDAIGQPLITDNWGNIDPTVYIDDDGQAYLYYGNPQLYYVKLNKNMISFDKTVGIVKVPLTEESFGKRTGNKDRATLYEEGPWFYKRNGLYYMVFAASGIPENIAYATSTSPTGPWTYKGIIMPTEGGSFTNHPGNVDYKGNSYIFYHNGALPKGGGFTRSVAVEKFEYNTDGSFPTIKMTKDGPASLSNLNPYIKNEAETIAWESGVETEACSKGGMDVCDINDGDYIKVKSVDFGSKDTGSFEASVASASNGGKIELHLDSSTGKVLGTLSVSSTGGEDTWKTQATNISGATGVHDLYFVFKGETTGNLFKVDYWKFSEKSAATVAHELVEIKATIDRDVIDITSGANTANLKVTAIYSDGTSEDVTAQVETKPDQDGIVKINNGIVTGVAYGSTSITVSFGGKTVTLNVNVKNLKKDLTVNVSGVTLNKKTLSLVSGKSGYLTAKITPSDATNKKVTWKSSNTKVAKVDKNGKVTAIVAGSAIIKVTTKDGNYEATCKVFVKRKK